LSGAADAMGTARAETAAAAAAAIVFKKSRRESPFLFMDIFPFLLLTAILLYLAFFVFGYHLAFKNPAISNWHMDVPDQSPRSSSGLWL
jgi:hypothetical protein